MLNSIGIHDLRCIDYEVFSGCEVNLINFATGPPEFDCWISKDLVG